MEKLIPPPPTTDTHALGIFKMSQDAYDRDLKYT
jgi:hypothetical protein